MREDLEVFRNIIGHAEAKRLLGKALRSGQEPHAFLFVGPSGVGKSSIANAYCRALLCETRAGCGQCSSCKRFDSGSHPDHVRLYPGQKVDPDDKGEAIQIKAIRRLVLPRVTVGPAVGRAVAVIIEEADRMTWGAANALLKTLEEPPDWMRLVLTASASDAVPPTILSRCTLVALGPVALPELAEGLLRVAGGDPDTVKEAALASSGLPGRALRLLEDPQARDRAKRVVEVVEALAGATPAEALALAERLQHASAASAEESLSARMALADGLALLAQCFRDAAVLAMQSSNENLSIRTAETAISRLAPRASPGFWCDCARHALETRNGVLGNASARYQLDALMTRVLVGMTV